MLSAEIIYAISDHSVGLGGLAVTCSLLNPRFLGSNPAEFDEFFTT